MSRFFGRFFETRIESRSLLDKERGEHSLDEEHEVCDSPEIPGSQEERSEKLRGRDRTVYVCKTEHGRSGGISVKILREFPSLEEIRGTLVVHRERDLTEALKWMNERCGPRFCMNVVGSCGKVDRLLEAGYRFLSKWGLEANACLRLSLNGSSVLGFELESICRGKYRVLTFGSHSDIRSSSWYLKLLSLTAYNGVRGLRTTTHLPTTLRYFEGSVTNNSLTFLLENFPYLEHIVSDSDKALGRWVSPNVSDTPVLRSLQVWVFPEDLNTIFHELPNISVLHTQDSRGHRSTHERPHSFC